MGKGGKIWKTWKKIGNILGKLGERLGKTCLPRKSVGEKIGKTPGKRMVLRWIRHGKTCGKRWENRALKWGSSGVKAWKVARFSCGNHGENDATLSLLLLIEFLFVLSFFQRFYK